MEDTPRWGDGTEGLAPVTVYTVGAVLEKHRGHVVVARDIYWDPDSGSLVTGGRLALPNGMIVSKAKIGEIHAPNGNSGRGKATDHGGPTQVLREPIQEPRRHRRRVVGDTREDGNPVGGGPLHGVVEDRPNSEGPEAE